MVSMLFLCTLRQNGFKRIESVLSFPYRTRIVFKMIQTRECSALNDVEGSEPPSKKSKMSECPGVALKSGYSSQLIIFFLTVVKKKKKADATSSNSTHRWAQVPDGSMFLKRVDSPWKVGAHVSAVGGVENTVLNAVSIG